MKVIRLTTLLDFGGQERKYLLFTESPEGLQHEYVFAALGYGGHTEGVLRSRGFRVRIFNRNPKISTLSNIWVLYRWFRQERPDVVHTAAGEANFHGILAARLAGVRTIIGEEIGLPTHSRKAQYVFRWVYRLAHRVVCVSRSVHAFLVALGELEPARGVVVYNPVSVQAVLPKVPSSVFTLVCVGRLERVKNHTVLLQALAPLAAQPFRLLLVGEGRERQALEAEVAAYGLTERVAFVGFSATPETYLAQADLFVLPSLSEGFGIAVVEALLQQVPCLCSAVGGVPEFITDTETGWLFDPQNVPELTTKLAYIMGLPAAERQAVALKGYTSVIGKFTPEQYQRTLEHLYENPTH